MKTMDLKEAKKFWLVGLGIQFAYYLYIIIVPFMEKIAVPEIVIDILINLSSVLVIVAMKIISDLANDQKIFYYPIAGFVMNFVWKLLRKPISNMVFKAPATSKEEITSILWRSLFFDSIPYWVIILASVFLMLLALKRISTIFNDSRFKNAGVIQFVGCIISVVYGILNISMVISKQMSNSLRLTFWDMVSKISGWIMFVSIVLWVIALVIEVIAIVNMKLERRKEEEI